MMEENEEIKAEFQGYKEGMVRLKEGGWAMLPSTAAMIDTYKVQQCNHTAWAILQLFSFAINSRTVPVLVVGLQIPPTTTSYKYVVILSRRNIIFRPWR